MVTNKKTYFFLLATLAVTSMGMQCNKNLVGCTESIYSFTMEVRAFPDKDTIQVGDTIWIEVNSADRFIDANSHSEVDFSGANNLGTNVGLVKLVNTNPLELGSAVKSFRFSLLNGREISSLDTSTLKSYLITETNGRYLFKLGIVPKEKGTFRFNLENPVNVMRNGQSCPKASFSMKLVDTDQHYYLYPGAAGVTPGGADYFFYVK